VLDQILQRENMFAALARVERNKGAAGVDGMTVEGLRAFLKEHWLRIRTELLDGRYVPQPVRRVDIPKAGGGTRTLGIPTVLDRLIQQAILQVMQPLLDPTFSHASFGFRPRRGQQMAVQRARTIIAHGATWVVDMDLEKFFDRVNHDVLMARVAKRIEDKRVLRLIRAYLRAGMMDGGLVTAREEGTPQGGPLSPLLSNLLLDDLDRELERRGHQFVRFADDCNVYVQSRSAGERVFASIERFLAARLRLKVNRTKSAVARPWERKFLGFTFTKHRQPRVKVARESINRFKQRLKPEFRRARGSSMQQALQRMRPMLAGWSSYYRIAEVRDDLERLDQWIRRHLRAVIWRQWKTPRNRERQLVRRGVKPADARVTARNGRGPWFCSGVSTLNHAISKSELRRLGLVDLLPAQRRLAFPT